MCSKNTWKSDGLRGRQLNAVQFVDSWQPNGNRSVFRKEKPSLSRGNFSEDWLRGLDLNPSGRSCRVSPRSRKCRPDKGFHRPASRPVSSRPVQSGRVRHTNGTRASRRRLGALSVAAVSFAVGCPSFAQADPTAVAANQLLASQLADAISTRAFLGTGNWREGDPLAKPFVPHRSVDRGSRCRNEPRRPPALSSRADRPAAANGCGGGVRSGQRPGAITVVLGYPEARTLRTTRTK